MLLLAVFGYYFLYRRTPYTVASIITGFKVPTSFHVEEYRDEWSNNLSGDGESFVVFSFTDEDEPLLEKNCKLNGYKILPLTEVLPDNTLNNYIVGKKQVGYYKLEVDEKDERSYQIAILNLHENKLVVYNVIY